MRKYTLLIPWLLVPPVPVVVAAGPYLELGAGALVQESALNTNGPTFLIDSDYGTGWSIRGGAGYGFDNGIRVEGEAGYRRTDLNRLRITRDGGLGASLGLPPLDGARLATTGESENLSFMLNGWYDVRTNTPFMPYIGGGLGVSHARLNRISVPGLQLVDDSDMVLAYQLGVGFAYALTPRASVTVDYRYFATSDARFTDFEGVSFSSEYRSHSFGMAFRFSL